MSKIILPGEQGAADAFVAAYGHAFRYVPAWHKYATWDGARWDTEAGDTLIRGMWQAHLADLVREALAKRGEARTEAMARVVERSSARYEGAMLTLCHARTVADYRDFDRDAYALNVENGILDLREGTLREHDPAALCTRLAPVTWDPNAECSQWLAYLDWAMCGDAERVAYLQRFFGLCLTGDAEHELAHFFWGEGGNGKTTVVKTIESIMGDYARRAPARLLMQRKHESHPTELAGLCGRRLVVLAETNESQTIDEQMLKTVASKDAISARRMREDFWDFDPTHKTVLLTNNRPRVRGQDEGVWRRIRYVEWNAHVDEASKDPHFAERFVPERSGILRWAWEGLRQVRTSGTLAAPASVQASTAEYRGSEDSVPRWVEAECIVDVHAETPAAELYASYSAWAERTFETRLTLTAFGRRLTAHEYADRKGAKGVRLRRGLRLRERTGPFARPRAAAE